MDTVTPATEPAADLFEAERDILARVARGGPLKEVLRDLIYLVEKPADGEMLASILVLSEDGTRLLEGAAPNLPPEYNAAIDGVAIGPEVGSCGTAAYSGKPVFVADIATDPLWRDYRDLALQHGLAACWSVPVKSGEGEILGTFANYYREVREPTDRDMKTIVAIAHTAAIAIERHRTETARERSDEQRALVMRELNHRVKNIFSLTNALISMTARNSTSVEELTETLRSRLSALDRSHDLITVDAALKFQGSVPVEDLLQTALAPFIDHHPGTVTVEGPDLSIPNHLVSDFALLIHELATNAAKYGSLSATEGRLSIRWKTCDDRFSLVWQERGGPRVEEPSETGFGSTLLCGLIEQRGGSINFDWAAEGMQVSVELPVGELSVPN